MLIQPQQQKRDPPYNRQFFLPAALESTLESEPIEQVNFLRDEMANMVCSLSATGAPAGGETLATQRMKRSGMRWRHTGGQAILTLRSLHQSERFNRAWKLLSDTYKRTVAIPENVVFFPKRKAH